MTAEYLLDSYTIQDLRRLCREITRMASKIVLDGHRIRIHDMHPHYVTTGVPVKEHEHSYYEGHLFMEGGGIYNTGPEEFVGRAGTLLHEPHTPHSWQASEQSALRMLIWFSIEPKVTVPRPTTWPVCEDLLQEVFLLLGDADAGLPGWHHRVNARMTIILSRLLSVAGWPSNPEAAPQSQNDLVSNIKQFFQDNLARPLALSDVAAHAGMSERTLSRRFLEISGETAMECLFNLRMDRAVSLLTDTDIPLTQIGEQIGLPDPSYFCRRFKCYFHQTPNGYRKGMSSK